MRDYVYHLAQMSEVLPGQGILAQVWHNWMARRAVARLDRLDDHLLRDIGLTRKDIDQALQRPYSEDAVLALQDIASRRRREERFVSRRA